MNISDLSRLDINTEYPYDSLWSQFCQHLGGPLNSHFYDITVYSSAILACIIVFFVKKHVKNRWFNIFLASGLSLFFYSIALIYSYRLRFNATWAITVFVGPMGFLMIAGLLNGNWKNRLILYGTAALTVIYNIVYCLFNEDHHKLCYSIKLFILILGIAGYIKNVIVFFKAQREKKNLNISSTADKTETSGSTETQEEVKSE